MAQSAGTSCAAGILQEDLPKPSPAVRTQVFGHQALVETRTDTVFLSEFPQDWKVIAAGCTPQGDKP